MIHLLTADKTQEGDQVGTWMARLLVLETGVGVIKSMAFKAGKSEWRLGDEA